MPHLIWFCRYTCHVFTQRVNPRLT